MCSTLDAVCGGTGLCQYADWDTPGTTGHCPVGYFATK